MQINEDSEELNNLSAETLYRSLTPIHYFFPGSLDFTQCRQLPTLCGGHDLGPWCLVRCFTFRGLLLWHTSSPLSAPHPPGSRVCHHSPSPSLELGCETSILQAPPLHLSTTPPNDWHFGGKLFQKESHRGNWGGGDRAQR